jgi:enoyl-CoA hydratase/carnithine racemase
VCGTRFRLPDLGMGLGRWRTLYLALSGRALDVGTALDWGLVDGIALAPGD